MFMNLVPCMVFHVFMACVFIMVHVQIHAWHVVTSWWFIFMTCSFTMVVHVMSKGGVMIMLHHGKGLFMTCLFHAW